MKCFQVTCFTVATMAILSSTPTYAVTIDTVTVGNPGNPADTDTAPGSVPGLGSVAATFEIGRSEVTNSQWVEFLNTVDPNGDNTLALWGGAQMNNANGGINRVLGNSVGSRYEVKSGFDNKPVIFVTLYDAMRFTNWLHNGQGSGDTESGSYTLLGGTPTPTNDVFGSLIMRNPGATWALPGVNEWYKAAYYDPSVPTYWEFPTQSDSTPTDEPPPGGVNSANYNVAVTPAPNITDVGAYSSSVSFYGTFDQGGNVFEWLDTPGDATPFFLNRRLAGGSWTSQEFFMDKFNFLINDDPGARDNKGFRVVNVIPEPTSLVLFTVGAVLMLTRRRSD